MSRARSVCAALAALLVAACAEKSPTALVARGEPAEDLDFIIPSLTPDVLVAQYAEAPAADGPAKLAPPGEEPPPIEESGDDISDYLDAVGSIYDARTTVGFGPGYGYAFGEHWYQGNKGRVETTVRVSSDGQELGSQTQARENYEMFLLDFGIVHYISVQARFYTDQDCGLSAAGSSGHRAWWEWFLGGGAAHWGDVVVSTQAAPVDQPECPPPPNVSTVDGSPGVVCYFVVEYDPFTGEVFDVELLGCVGG
jgi:hypothetical protein